jgi:putative DNA primase/helicase
MSASPLAGARQLAGRTRWLLFPTRDKAPAISAANGGHGLNDATADPGELARLFHLAPDADGSGVNCGASNLIVLDVDTKPGLDGRDSLRDAGLPWLEADTPRASTPRGGEHVFFSGTLPSRIGVLPGVDVKGTGGYVVLPPAPGRAWLADASPWDLSPVPVPAWLLRLAGPSTGAGSPRWAAALEDYVSEGRRNDTAASIAGKLVYHGVPDRLVILLVLAWTRSFCRPALPDSEALVIVKSILSKGTQ